ncbi:MAG: FAD-binding oxidoreductase [Chloroflexi bacterium]|nr:FAD-binding oxidoreductase [Chloroflexota bacterium]
MEQQKNNGAKLRVVVVGAGIVGATIAFNLSLRDVDVTIVDSRQPGDGASGHSFAWLNSFGKEPADYHLLNRRSMDMWDRLARRLGSDIGLHWGGELRWESTSEGAEGLRKRVKRLQGLGYPTRIINEDEMLRIEPGLSPGNVTAVEFSSIDGRVDPPMVARVCLDRASALGASVRVDTPVTGLSSTGNGNGGIVVNSVQTADGDIPCDVVVLAAGVGTTELAAMVGLNVPQEVSPGVVIRTDPRPRVIDNVSVLYAPPISADYPEIHMRQNADGTLMIGEGSQESLNRDDSQKHADDLLKRAIHFLPALDGAKAIPVPVGYRPMPTDGLPILGFTKAAPNLYIALMHSGVTLAPIVGEMSVLEIVDGARIEMLDSYRFERFSDQALKQ